MGLRCGSWQNVAVASLTGAGMMRFLAIRESESRWTRPRRLP